MHFIRTLSNSILRYRKSTGLLIFSLLCLMMIFQGQNNYLNQLTVFEDSVSYCNSPVRRHVMHNQTYKGYSLKQIHLLIRHGDRAPIELNSIPNTQPVSIPCFFNETSPFYQKELAKIKNVLSNEIFETIGSSAPFVVDERTECAGGQLTPNGYLQHLFLGNSFKNTYREFLVGIDVEKDIHIQATDVARTIQSGAAFLSGAFYTEFIRYSPKLKINVFKDRILHGHMLLDENYQFLHCPALSEQYKRLRRSSAVKTFFGNIEPMMKKFASILLSPRNSMPSYNRVVDVLFAKLCHGQGIPAGPRSRLPNSLVKQALQFSHMYFKLFHSTLAELQSLSLLSQLALRSLDVIREKPNAKKVVVYSGHDTMVAPFLHILGIWDGLWPPYAANVIVEFYEKETKEMNRPMKKKILSTYFRVLYNGVAMRNIKFCHSRRENDELCSVADLYTYVSDNIFDVDSLEPGDESSLSELIFNRIKSLCENGQ